ncbi:MAG: GIY-YIG nuclease family protein [Pseudomonadota bacterium]|nr:GIY-YIG nuclease family protein [Pseudomonadota bacterium]
MASKAPRFTDDDDALLDALGIDVESATPSRYTARQERVLAGFEDIQRFVAEHGHAPRHGEGLDIFERLYAVRLEQLRAQPDCVALLEPLDTQGLLAGALGGQPPMQAQAVDDDALLAQLGGVAVDDSAEIQVLRHVRSRADIRAAEEIAARDACPDFDQFQPLFEQAERELKAGVRQARRFAKDASVEQGNFFILSGQMVYVAEVGEIIKAPNGENDARLRLIYANGTQSNLLRRSLQRALYKDEAGRRLSEPGAGPLFGDAWADDDLESGTIYVLRSKSTHPVVAEHRELIHKIGVTGDKVQARIGQATHDATYLLAEVEVVATYKLAGIHRVKLENLFHRLFAPAQLDLTLHDRFGQPVRPREWFLVPLHVIDEAVQRIRDGSITGLRYDPQKASLVSA